MPIAESHVVGVIEIGTTSFSNAGPRPALRNDRLQLEDILVSLVSTPGKGNSNGAVQDSAAAGSCLAVLDRRWIGAKQRGQLRPRCHADVVYANLPRLSEQLGAEVSELFKRLRADPS